MGTNNEHLLQGVRDCRERFHDNLTGAWVGNRIRRRTRNSKGRLEKWGEGIICPIWYIEDCGKGYKVSNGDAGKEIAITLGEAMGLRNWKEIYPKLPKPFREERGSISSRKPPGAVAKGNEFERAIRQYLVETYQELITSVFCPGDYLIETKNNQSLEKFSQYSHLDWQMRELSLLKEIAEADTPGPFSEKARMILNECPHGQPNSYQTSPDITISRSPIIVPVDETGLSPDNHLFTAFEQKPTLLAICSAKWTLRSDRAQNSRSEVSYLEKERRGHKCRFVVVTAETTPSIISSIALGNEVDCTYHIALPELLEAARTVHGETDQRVRDLENLIATRRLKDVFDLPFDLAV